MATPARRSGPLRSRRAWVGLVAGLALSAASVWAPRAAGGAAADASPWIAALRRLDAALARLDVSGAERAWADAQGAAVRARRWDGLIAVGDAYLRIGVAARGRMATRPRVRELYLAAFFRARHDGSLEGVGRAADAFAALGDFEVVEQCLRVAERLALARGEGRGAEDVAARRLRLLGGRTQVRTVGSGPVLLVVPDTSMGP